MDLAVRTARLRPLFNRQSAITLDACPPLQADITNPALAGGQIAPCEISRGSGEFLTGESHRGRFGRN